MNKPRRHHFLDYIAYLLMVICFPLNPLVLLDIIEPEGNNTLTIIGFIIWAFGMYLVIYPFFYFKMKGEVKKGKSYVHTGKIVTGGLYSIIRHVQYTGGIYSIFVATPLIYPHWIFLVLGIPGIILVYYGTKREDRVLIDKFGDEYRLYIENVPAINFPLGIIRKIKSRKQ